MVMVGVVFRVATVASRPGCRAGPGRRAARAAVRHPGCRWRRPGCRAALRRPTARAAIRDRRGRCRDKRHGTHEGQHALALHGSPLCVGQGASAGMQSPPRRPAVERFGVSTTSIGASLRPTADLRRRGHSRGYACGHGAPGLLRSHADTPTRPTAQSSGNRPTPAPLCLLHRSARGALVVLIADRHQLAMRDVAAVSSAASDQPHLDPLSETRPPAVAP